MVGILGKYMSEQSVLFVKAEFNGKLGPVTPGGRKEGVAYPNRLESVRELGGGK